LEDSEREYDNAKRLDDFFASAGSFFEEIARARLLSVPLTLRAASGR
jgi:hypothetical protein